MEILLPRNLKRNIILSGSDHKMLRTVLLISDLNRIRVQKLSVAAQKLQPHRAKNATQSIRHRTDHRLLILHQLRPINLRILLKTDIPVPIQRLFQFKWGIQ